MEPFREKGWSQGDLGCWEAELISSLEHSVNMNLKLYEEKIKSTARQYCNGVIKRDVIISGPETKWQTAPLKCS